MAKRKIIENEYQLAAYVQHELSEFVKKHTSFVPDGPEPHSELKHLGAYTLKIGDLQPMVKYDGRFYYAVIVDVFEDHEMITLVSDTNLPGWSCDSFSAPRGVGTTREVLACLDTMLQVALVQLILGAYELNK